MGVDALRLVVVIVLLTFGVSGCKQKEATPAPAEQRASAPTEKEADDEAADGPAYAKLRREIAAVVHELEEHATAGKRKARGDAACAGDFAKRLARTREIEKIIGAPAEWNQWPTRRFELASGLSKALIPLRACVNCSTEDAKECSPAFAAIAELRAATLADGGR